MTKKLGILASATLILNSAYALAQEFPQSGEAEYDTYYIFETKAEIDGNVGAGLIQIGTGITRNVNGDGPFHDMSVECLSHYVEMGDKWMEDGSCVETDKDGDIIFTTYDNNNHYITGGTGKYSGITGTVPYAGVELHKTPGGRAAYVVNHKATWSITN